MLFSLKDLEKFQIHAEGDDVGKIRAFLIDNYDWLVRYMVARVGGRNVAVVNSAFEKPDYVSGFMPVNVSRARLLNSPEIDMDRPLFRNLEQELHDYYEWPYYWEADEVPNTLPGDLTSIPLIEMELEREAQLVPDTGRPDTENEHLYSTKGIYGLPVYAANDDKNAGTLVDFIVNDENWHIQYMVIDTGDLFPGKKVALAPQWVQEFDEKNSRVQVDLKRDTIHNSPRFSTTVDLTPDYLENLRNYFDNQ